MKNTLDIESLLQTINEALFTVDRDCKIASFNRAAEELTGYTESEVLGRLCSDVFRSDICRTHCAVKESMARDRRVRRRLVTMHHRDGTPTRISVSTSPLHNGQGQVTGAVETIRPLSEEERLNEVLAGETSKTRAILSSLEEGVVTIDRNWKITSINAAAQRMLGVSADRAMGSLCSQVLGSDRCRNGCPLVKTLKENQTVRDEVITLTAAGGRPVEVSMNTGILQGPDGDAMGGVLSFREFKEVERLRAELAGEHHFRGIIGRSAAMREVFRLIQEVAASQATVLITGESGTGKEVVADAIQGLSPRRGKPYVKVNCSVLSDGVLESELFGHVKGAFTDAVQNRRGRFELADEGTLFLDEIGDLSPNIQVKLLRVLQERQFEMVGGEEPINVDVRFVAATHRSLEKLVQDGVFREDLFYRLNVIPVHLPPLRERREDIPLLVDHFLRKHSLITGKDITGIQDRALQALEAYHWPGNVRQLENCVEYALARAKGATLTLSLLPPDIRAASKKQARKPVQPGPPEGHPGHPGHAGHPGHPENHAGHPDNRPVGDGSDEAAVLYQAMAANHWHHGRAAEALGMSRTTLWRKLKKRGISK